MPIVAGVKRDGHILQKVHNLSNRTKTIGKCSLLFLFGTGYGIAEEEIPHIFKRFYRKSADSEDNNTHTGLGLGLAIASRILELHGSRLSVNSVLHQGTTFQFSLPAPR